MKAVDLRLKWVKMIAITPILLTTIGITQGISQTSETPQVNIEEREGYRYIISNGIPNHATGMFPNSGNPHTIAPQDHVYRVTLTPQLTGQTTPIAPAFGVALNGIPFEPGTAEVWSGNSSQERGSQRTSQSSQWRFEALTGFMNLGTDEHNAHVQPGGKYHYHGVPTALVSDEKMVHIGYGADGFPIYGPYGYTEANNASSELMSISSSYRLKAGVRPDGPGGVYDGTFSNDFEYVQGLGELDECNGRFGATPEHPEGIYHYYITEMFPFIPRCVKGTPDESFRPSGGGQGGSGAGDSPERRRPNGRQRGDRRPGRPNGRRPLQGRPDRSPEGRPSGDRPDGSAGQR